MDSSQAFTNVARFIERKLRQIKLHVDPAPRNVRLCVGCHLAEKDHVEAERYYAHTFHLVNAICVCEAFSELPTGTQYGILLHEFGHLYGGREECDADLWPDERLGVEIGYKGDGVQWVKPSIVESA